MMRQKAIAFLLWVCFHQPVLVFAQDTPPGLNWVSRDDLNVLLPPSVRVYETSGVLSDQAPVRAMCAVVDLRDDNLKLRAVGSNTLRETTWESYVRNNAILAINGGYFSATRSESLLVSDGELTAPGPQTRTRGAFGMVGGKPEIVWPHAIDSLRQITQYSTPAEIDHIVRHQGRPWQPAQAVGGGPVLIKDGRIVDVGRAEGFGGSHLVRHPRTAIGYRDAWTLVMVVVDGRQKASAGVTLMELAQMLYELGCYEAVNLDGGGSSAMVAADEVVNVPVDIPNGNRRSMRRNASALIVTEEVSSPRREVVVLDTEGGFYEEAGIWNPTNHANYYGDTPSREALAGYDNVARYRFTDIARDSFQLAAWWTVHEKNTAHATFVLHHNGQTDSIHVNQRSFTSDGKWNVLGRFLLGAGDYLEVVSRGEGNLVTDAIRLVRISELAPPPRGDLRIAVLSDLNSGLGSATYEWQVDSIIRRIPRLWRPDLVLCGGDMVAGMGISDTTTLTRMWAGFDKHIAAPLRTSGIPFAFTLGNHDGLRSYPRERQAVVEYWQNPSHRTGLSFVDSTNFPHYYSFLAGEVFVVSWDASSSQITSENLRWAQEQLETATARAAKMRTVIGHLPIYSVAQERDSKGNVLHNGDSLRRWLEQHHVDVYISGHQHAYYPGKRGTLQLLNSGAAGSGPRRWLTLDRNPVNTVTVMDIFHDRDTIVYSTYDIRHRHAKDMTLLDHRELPSSISGVNGLIIRNDVTVTAEATGAFYAGPREVKSYGTVHAEIRNGTLTVRGSIPRGENLTAEVTISLHEGRHTERGHQLATFPHKVRKGTVTFGGAIPVTDDMRERMTTGGYYVRIGTTRSPEDEDIMRAQLYPASNHPPEYAAVTSHLPRNVYGIRNADALYRVSWSPASDPDGDPVSYTYQISGDSLFKDIILYEHTGRATYLKKRERAFYRLLERHGRDGAATFYHRVIATDGLHHVPGPVSRVNMRRSEEPLTDLVEVDPAPYIAAGRIENAAGRGSGALWDKDGKLWLADYDGTLYIHDAGDNAVHFSPLTSVTVNGIAYTLRPVNGIGLDRDGNILVGSNRTLLKINASTGQGMAAWEAPEGKRAITTPRVNDRGEIYAMSLFAEDPNYVLKESATTPGTFELVRTLRLPGRILARTFDMSSGGDTLYFPDPGSPLIQVFIRGDGVNYRRGDDITSTAAGCNALAVDDGKLFATVRASGVSPTTLHFRDASAQLLWTLPLTELHGAEARGMAISPDQKTIIICVWDKGGGFYRYRLQ